MKGLRKSIGRMAMAVVALLCGVVAGYAQTVTDPDESVLTFEGGYGEGSYMGFPGGWYVTGTKKPVKNLVIPSKIIVDDKEYPVVGIASNAFTGMSELETLTIINKPETLGIGEREMMIGFNAFSGCTNLREVTIDTGDVLNIASGAFNACTSLTELDLTHCYPRLFSSAFSGCSGLRNIRLGFVDYVYNIGLCDPEYGNPAYKNVFSGVSGVESFEVNGATESVWPMVTDVHPLPYYTPVLTNFVSNELFGTIKHIGTLRLPGVTHYRSGAFEGMTIDHLVTSEYNTVYISADAFRDATVGHITAPYATPPVYIKTDETILDLSNVAVTVPKGCTSNYQRSPYWGQAALITEDEALICDVASEDALPTQLNGKLDYGVNADGNTLCYGLEYYGEDLYNMLNVGPAHTLCSIDKPGVGRTDIELIDLIMPVEHVEHEGRSYDVTEVAPYACANIPRSGSKYDYSSIYYERGMSKIRLSDRCERIGQHAFESMRFMQEYGDEPELDFGQGLREIGAYAFNGAEFGDFDTLEFPASLESIGANAFDGSNGVKNIVLNAVTPPATDGDALFTGARKRSFISLYVPDEAVEAYRSAPVWSDFNISPRSVWGGVQSVVTDADDAPAVYYNLQGIRIDAPSHGIYIRRAADGTSRLVRL